MVQNRCCRKILSLFCCSNGADNDESKMEQIASRAIDDFTGEEARMREKSIKLLLLGAGESGKSTLFKQIITIYGKGYSETERFTFKPIIEQNTLMAIRSLIQASYDLPTRIDDPCTMSEETRTIADKIMQYPLDHIIEDKTATEIEAIWKDPGIQICYENRSLFQFPDSGAYFFDKIHEIADQAYIPTQQDILHSRVRTTGIVETEFEIEGRTFHLFDVGGQRNERRKWIHCFENVTCVIFVAAISEYDQVLYEDETTNRMVETMKLFDEICNSKWFLDKSLILFLNKRDLFEEKIEKVPLTVMFPSYEGDPHDYEETTDYIRNTFESLNRSPGKEIYTHITCATNTDNVEHVFNSVKKSLIKNSLRDGGFM